MVLLVSLCDDIHAKRLDVFTLITVSVFKIFIFCNNNTNKSFIQCYFLISCYYIDCIPAVKHSRAADTYPALYIVFPLCIFSQDWDIFIIRSLFKWNSLEMTHKIVRWWRFWTDFWLLFRPTFTLAERPEPERTSSAVLPVLFRCSLCVTCEARSAI